MSFNKNSGKIKEFQFLKFHKRTVLEILIINTSSGKSINDYQWIEMHKKSHARFKEKYGGDVFFVFSTKGSNGKKQVHNTGVTDDIINEINRLKG